MRYGALEEEWKLFSDELGLTADLLPCVSNPNAPISPKSKMKTLGKTPSRYYGEHVGGIKDWTSFKATAADINDWKKEPDYGICLQTRHVRALDIDIIDRYLSTAITEFIDGLQISPFPKRFRNNSGKCLLAFKVRGELPKRVCKVEGGIIEFLGTGQQFIAAGTHPSSARYEWDWGDHEDFPTLSLEQFEELWAALVKEFGTAPAVESGIRQKGQHLNIDDPLIGKLDILSWGSDGSAYITCPNIAEHTTDNGDSQTAYFPAGTNGYERGHFKCLHAHCQELSDEDFINMLGLQEDHFEVIENESKEVLAKSLPKFEREKSGKITPIINNLCMALTRADVCDSKIAYDAFRDEVVITSNKNTALEWRALEDNDYTILQRHLENKKIGFKPIDLNLLRRAVNSVAYENHFDSAQIWLDALQWDGIPRVEHFMQDVLGTNDNAYTRAISNYMWSAMAGRILKPGVKADMMIILQGEEGLQKSSLISLLPPIEDYFIELQFDENDADLARKMRGKLVAEIAELRGLITKDQESVRAFVSRRREEWIPKFKEKAVIFYRRLLFFGTTNEETPLVNEGKLRRWLPVKVGKVDTNKLIHNRLQLWAEGKAMFLKSGVAWQNAERLAPTEHDSFVQVDVWQDFIHTWLHTPDSLEGGTPLSKGYLLMKDILQHALNLDVKSLKGIESRRVAKILKNMGYTRYKERIDKGDPKWVWVETKRAGADLV